MKKLHESRLKAEADLSCQQQKIVDDAVLNGDYRVRVERLVNAAEEAMTKTCTKTSSSSR